jgi:putative Holliday junction resolvase
MTHGRILALDYGTKNIGAAYCDELHVTIQPLPSIARRNRQDLIKRIVSLLQEHRIDRMVIGLPVNMDGSEGEAVERVRQFMKALQSSIPIPLHTMDERLSTVEAEEVWQTMNARQQKKYRTVDSLAAAFILKRFLEES